MRKIVKNKKWELLSSHAKDKNLVDILLTNRGIKTEKQRFEFLHPKDPVKLGLKELGISDQSIKKAINRIKKAIKNNEHIVVYGDYDADGICATAILWECLYALTKKVIPYIPDRFSEGYGINPESVSKIKSQNPKVGLILTVDNGIVAFDALETAKELGIDVIITDHHAKDLKLPKACAIVHTTKIAGSGVAWVLAREIRKGVKNQESIIKNIGLELCAIGTIADQLPLTGANRSIAKYGLQELNQTKRTGLLALFEEAAIKKGNVGTYEVNYLIAPRLNAMGRLEHAIDSLRLLCIKDKNRAIELASHIGNINKQRQKIVDEVLIKARIEAVRESDKGAIVISGNYHEGVIGLAAGKLVEEFGRPAIVFSIGIEKSKASARSISGFNIIEEIKKMKTLLIGAGGHPMAAGLSIETKNISKFKKEFQNSSVKILTQELLTKILKIDVNIEFDQINYTLHDLIDKLKPFGQGNPSPMFITENVSVVRVKSVGSDGKHSKLDLKKAGLTFSSIFFNIAKDQRPTTNDKINIVYAVEENVWNGNRSLQLKVKDLKVVNQ